MKLMGIDLGKKRIGVAFADQDLRIVLPGPVIRATGTLQLDADTIAHAACEAGVNMLVVGVPTRLGNQHSRQAEICVRLAGMLRDKGFCVAMIDEARSSIEAEASMRSAGLDPGAIKQYSDSMAAVIILQRYLEADG